MVALENRVSLDQIQSSSYTEVVKNSQKILVIATAFLALFLLVLIIIWGHTRPPVLPPVGNPMIGSPKSPVHLILIEDYRCSACRRFSRDILVQLEQIYLNTGKASCSFVPIPLLEGSKPLANASLEVYSQDPEQFLPFIHALFEESPEKLISLAQRFPSIDIDRLQTCLDTDCYAQQLELNLSWAKRIMGLGFGTPALYVNGVRVPTISLEEIKQKIDQFL